MCSPCPGICGNVGKFVENWHGAGMKDFPKSGFPEQQDKATSGGVLSGIRCSSQRPCLELQDPLKKSGANLAQRKGGLIPVIRCPKGTELAIISI